MLGPAQDEQDAEGPDTDANAPLTEAQRPLIADLAAQVKNLTEIVGHLVKKKKKPTKRKHIMPSASESSKLFSDSDSNSDDASGSAEQLASLTKMPYHKKTHAKKNGCYGSHASSDNFS